jgi:prolyl 4-hydroxylase
MGSAPHSSSSPGGEAFDKAVRFAWGVDGIADWAETRRHIEDAARLGHPSARKQWERLDPLGTLRPDLWPRPEPVVICRAPVILALPELVPKPVCEHLIERGRSLVRGASVFDEETGGARSDSARSNRAGSLSADRTDIATAVVRFLISRESGVPLSGLEPTQILHYSIGQSFDWHVDHLDPSVEGFRSDIALRGQRIATCLVYLNDDFEGGNTAFATDDIRHRGRSGDALMWSNVLPDGAIDPDTVHAGLPPTSGEKWVLSQWIRDRLQPR